MPDSPGQNGSNGGGTLAGAPLVLVSNRGPVTFDLDENGERIEKRGTGGLVTALTGLVNHRVDTLWVASAMTEAAGMVRSGEVTTAVKDAKGKVGAIKSGQIIGISDHEIEVVLLWQLGQVIAVPPKLAVPFTWALCVNPVGTALLVTSLWHMMQEEVFAPYQRKSTPAVVVVFLLLWQSIVLQALVPAFTTLPV